MTNPLLQKYDELYGQKEEPKPVLKSYTRHDSTIRTLETLLEEFLLAIVTGKQIGRAHV